MTKKLLSLAAACLLTFGAFAQNTTGRNCGTTHMQDELIKSDPSLRLRMDQIEQQTKDYELQNASNKSASVVITIPVVFHVLYNINNTTQNVSDARLMEQINVLNLDFSHTNADANNAPAVFKALAANTNIQFCLAVRDPNGLTTTGIIRKFTNKTNAVFPYPSNDMKSNATGGDDPWPAASYLNIWVCDISGGILGFAYLPPAPANIDGVVLKNGTVGGPAAPGTATPYNLGRTATHEVGHYLNMNHIWGDDGGTCSGSDLVNDTPNQGDENYSCPVFPTVSCNNGPNGDMFMNYMDYVDDNCMNMFSAGQSTRMNALFAPGGARVGLTTSQGCVPVGGGSCGTPTNLSAQAITSSGATLNWTAVSGGTTYYIQYRVSGTTTWTPTNTTTTSIALTGLTASTTYEYRVSAYCSTTYGFYTSIYTFTTSAAGGCGVPASIQVNAISQTGAAFYWSAVIGATSYEFQYRKNGINTWTTVTTTTANYGAVGLGLFTAGTTYDYRVRAICSGVASAYTATANFTTLAATGCGTPTSLAALNIQQTSAAINWLTVSGATKYKVQYRVSGTTTWTSINATTSPKVISGLSSGTVYNYRARAICGTTNGPWTSILNFTTLSAGGACTGVDIYETNNTITTAPVISPNADLYPLINPTGDKDYFKITTTAAAPNLKVIVDGLPDDYDVVLYLGSNGAQLGFSNNAGTTSESVIYNTTANATYKVYVYGYNGAFNATSCYHLKVITSANAFREDNSLNVSEKSSVAIFPNPSKGNLTITLESDDNQSTTINIVDLVGRSLYQSVKEVTEGTNTIDVDLNHFADGVYFVQTNTNGELTSNKIIIKK